MIQLNEDNKVALNEPFYTESLILVVDGARCGPLESQLESNYYFQHFLYLYKRTMSH